MDVGGYGSRNGAIEELPARTLVAVITVNDQGVEFVS